MIIVINCVLKVNNIINYYKDKKHDNAYLNKKYLLFSI